MFIYLVVFFSSICFMELANRSMSSKNRYILLALSIIPLIVLAALRGDSVGVDVRGYQKDLYNKAFFFDSAIKYLKWSYEEPGYSLVTFLGSRLNHFAFVHAFNMIIILIPMYYVIWKVRDNIDPGLSLATFLALYYVQGYNTVRQQMAISMLTIGTYCFSQKKYFSSMLFAVLAISFHYSAVVGISIYVLYWMSHSKLKRIYQLFFILITIVAAFNYEYLGKKMSAYVVDVLHVAKTSYRSSRAWSSNAVDVNETYLIMGLAGMAVLILVRFSKYEIDQTNNIFLLYMMFIVFASVFITGRMGFAARIFCYFEIWVIFAIPQFIKLISEDWMSQLLARIIMYGMLTFLWIEGVVIKGWHGVIPYYTFWQN